MTRSHFVVLSVLKGDMYLFVTFFAYSPLFKILYTKQTSSIKA